MGLWGVIGRGIVKGVKWAIRHPDVIKGAIDVAKGATGSKRDSSREENRPIALCLAKHPTRELHCQRALGHGGLDDPHTALTAGGYVSWPVEPRDDTAPSV